MMRSRRTGGLCEQTRSILSRFSFTGLPPTVARDVARHRLLDEILSFFGGRA
ncbi:MAG TPA: hypothetical protein VLW65_24580 [Bryobacteraceae bacterium]|nr:hypothetical protein [Bryobacteraceae bacterium]